MMLHYDPSAAVSALCRADKYMARIVRLAGPLTLTPEPMQSVFQALARAIVYQQLSGKAAGTIYRRVLETVGGKRKFGPRRILDLPEEELRGAGLSRAKVAALRDLAHKTVDRTVPTLAKLEQMDDEEIVDSLVQVRGIGRWTAEMLLIFRLGRPDVLPLSDLGVRKGFMLLYQQETLPGPEEITLKAETWRPYRSVASWYLWRAVEHLGRPPFATDA